MCFQVASCRLWFQVTLCRLWHTVFSGCVMQTLAQSASALPKLNLTPMSSRGRLCFQVALCRLWFQVALCRLWHTVFSGCVMQTLAQSASALPKLNLTPMSSRGRLCFQVASCRLWHARVCMMQPENTVCLCLT